MLSLDTFILFLSTSLLLAITPGPDNLYVLMQSARYNQRTGLFITLGLCTGLVLHSLAVAFGLSALIVASPLTFSTIKLAGAAYLAYLAWQAFQADALSLQDQDRSQPVLTYGQFYRQGIVMNITNPKIALFFLAFLPQFVDLAKDNVATQILQIGAMFIVVTLLVFSVIILLSARIKRWIAGHPKRQTTMTKLTGLVLLILAIHIAFFSG